MKRLNIYLFSARSRECLLKNSKNHGLLEDKLGKLNLTMDGLARRDQKIFAVAERLGVPMVVTMGGGYGDPIGATVAAHAQTYLAAKDWYARIAAASSETRKLIEANQSPFLV